MDDALQVLLTEAGHASWIRFAGLIILAAVALGRDLTSGIEGRWAEWISVVTHFLGGVGTALAAGGDSAPWWLILGLGIVGSFTSSGLAGKLRGLITKAVKGGGAVAMILFLGGCGANCDLIHLAHTQVEHVADRTEGETRDMAETAASILNALECEE